MLNNIRTSKWHLRRIDQCGKLTLECQERLDLLLTIRQRYVPQSPMISVGAGVLAAEVAMSELAVGCAAVERVVVADCIQNQVS